MKDLLSDNTPRMADQIQPAGQVSAYKYQKVSIVLAIFAILADCLNRTAFQGFHAQLYVIR